MTQIKIYVPSDEKVAKLLFFLKRRLVTKLVITNTRMSKNLYQNSVKYNSLCV